MKVCVFGAGAVGGHLAGRLARGGADVSVVARGEHLAAVQRDGLTVRTPEKEFRAPVAASDDPGALGPQDAVLVTVKAPALTSVARSIAPLLKRETPVVFVMNGIPWWYFYAHGGALDGTRLPRLDPGDVLWTTLGPQRAVGGVINSPCSVIRPGVIEVERSFNHVFLGEPDGSISARALSIADLLQRGGMEAEVTGEIRNAVWDKLLANLMTGPMAVLTQASYRDVLAERACVEAAARVVEEGSAVARALGCQPRFDGARRLSDAMRSSHKPSILQDLERGRPMEIDGIFQTILDLAEHLQLPVPTIELLASLAKLRARAAGLYAG